MEFEGTVVMELPMTEGIGKSSGRPWKKREWVMETGGGMYPRKVKIQAFGDRADAIQLQVGQAYAISFEIESREYNGRWYTDINAIAARPLASMGVGMQPQQAYGQPPYGQPAPAQPAPAQPAAPAQQAQFGAPAAPAVSDPFAGGDNNTDDLPF